MDLSLVPDPMMYGLAALCFGGWLGLFYMVRLLFTGRLCTGRELDEKNAENIALRERLFVREEQLFEVAKTVPEIAHVLQEFHALARQQARGES